MTAALQPLLALLGHYERERDEASAQHQRALAASRAAAAQTEQLRDYRSEHEQRWRTQFGREGKMELVLCYQSFTERLTQAVDHQSASSAQAALQVAQALVALQAIELRCASVRKLIERRTFEDQRNAERRDQKQTDEFAARAAWDRRSAGAKPRPM